jgi:DNA-binding NarL/FixJ family response regulator
VVAVIPDLFFATRVQAQVARLGGEVRFVPSQEELGPLLQEVRPRLVLVDLSARGWDPAAAIAAAKAGGADRVVAFGPHKDLAARSGALAAGADRWVANQRLLESLQELLG